MTTIISDGGDDTVPHTPEKVRSLVGESEGVTSVDFGKHDHRNNNKIIRKEREREDAFILRSTDPPYSIRRLVYSRCAVILAAGKRLIPSSWIFGRGEGGMRGYHVV